MVLANGVGGVRDADYVDMLLRVRTRGFDDMPVEFRELSPSYRAIDPDGLREGSNFTAVRSPPNELDSGRPTRSRGQRFARSKSRRC
jgi:hypothetical protein